jgi:hypothetical protein
VCTTRPALPPRSVRHHLVRCWSACTTARTGGTPVFSATTERTIRSRSLSLRLISASTSRRTQALSADAGETITINIAHVLSLRSISSPSALYPRLCLSPRTACNDRLGYRALQLSWVVLVAAGLVIVWLGRRLPAQPHRAGTALLTSALTACLGGVASVAAFLAPRGEPCGVRR